MTMLESGAHSQHNLVFQKERTGNRVLDVVIRLVMEGNVLKMITPFQEILSLWQRDKEDANKEQDLFENLETNLLTASSSGWSKRFRIIDKI